MSNGALEGWPPFSLLTKAAFVVLAVTALATCGWRCSQKCARATIGFWGVRGQPHAVKLGVLAFTAGILRTVAVEEIVIEAHDEEDSRWASIFLVGGFAIFALLSANFGRRALLVPLRSGTSTMSFRNSELPPRGDHHVEVAGSWWPVQPLSPNCQRVSYPLHQIT